MGSLKAANTYFHTNCSMSQPKKAESKFSKSADLCGNKCGLLSKVSLLQLMRQVSRRWLHYHQTSFTAAVYCSCERKRSFDGHWVVRCPQRTSTCNLSFSSVLSMIDLPSIVTTPQWPPQPPQLSENAKEGEGEGREGGREGGELTASLKIEKLNREYASKLFEAGGLCQRERAASRKFRLARKSHHTLRKENSRFGRASKWGPRY